MTPQEELERFFQAYSKREREDVEFFSEYHNAIADGNFIAAMEIASVILTPYLHIREVEKILRKKFPKYSN